MVIIARKPPRLQDVEYVSVPISVRALEEALERAAAERRSAPRAKRSATSTRPTRITRTGSRPVVAPQMVRRPGAARVRPAIKQNVHFRPGDYLFGRFRHALSAHTGKAVLLRCGEILMAADASRHTVFANTPQARLWATAAVQVPDATTITELTVLNTLNPQTPLPGAEHVYEQALDSFMWSLAVAAAQGRVAEGTPLDAPVYLRRWPNFTRLAPFDNAMRIAAVWVHQPRSLLNLYETLEVPVENVLTLYTAAEAIGLAGNAKREADTLIAPAVVTPSPYGNLIGAVLNRFVRADKADDAA